MRGRWVGVVGVLVGKGNVEVGKRDSTEGGEPKRQLNCQQKVWVEC